MFSKEFKQNNINENILFKFINKSDIFNISKDKLKFINKLIKFLNKCINNKSFKLMTNLKFLKNRKEYNKLYDIFDPNIKTLVEFIVYHSNYMSMKVYHDFKKNL